MSEWMKKITIETLKDYLIDDGFIQWEFSPKDIMSFMSAIERVYEKYGEDFVDEEK
jgi:hypothetical protein